MTGSGFHQGISCANEVSDDNHAGGKRSGSTASTAKVARAADTEEPKDGEAGFYAGQKLCGYVVDGWTHNMLIARPAVSSTGTDVLCAADSKCLAD